MGDCECRVRAEKEDDTEILAQRVESFAGCVEAQWWCKHRLMQSECRTSTPSRDANPRGMGAHRPGNGMIRVNSRSSAAEL